MSGRRTIFWRRVLGPVVVASFVVVLGACGGANAVTPYPSGVPAATRMAQVFKPAVTATIPPPQATSTHIALSTTNDPRVRTSCAAPAPVTASAVDAEARRIDIDVDPNPTGKLISPLIYGVAAAPAEQVRELGATVNRWGGNQVTRHNWEINASSAGGDWYFANVPHGWPEMEPGEAANGYIRSTQAVSAATILTIPTIGYVAKDGDNATRSQDVPAKGGAPVWPGAEAIANYDPAANQRATSLPSYAAKGRPFSDSPDLADGAVYQDEWINHLVQTFGRTDQGGVNFYALDNEPDLWATTHRDIRPAQMSYDAMLAMFKEYSSAIKAVDPSAQILAPEIWGVSSLFYSELDRGTNNFRSAPDRAAHGNMPFIPWFLAQAKAYDEQTGRRHLDVLTVHNYPQSGVYRRGDDPKTNALRLRSTQELWNPTYVNESWVSRTEGARLALIPRLRGWVDSYYPGTRIGITEWNYGADDTISGGLAIADVLGIFGREGLDLATYWTVPQPNTPGASAFKLYGNYDGCGRHFGDQLLDATSSDEPSVSAFASRDSYSGDTLVVVVNKLPTQAAQGVVRLSDDTEHPVMVYQFDASQTSIRRLADLTTERDGFRYAVPPYSATLFVVKATSTSS